jgi:hypothetical protein
MISDNKSAANQKWTTIDGEDLSDAAISAIAKLLIDSVLRKSDQRQPQGDTLGNHKAR